MTLIARDPGLGIRDPEGSGFWDVACGDAGLLERTERTIRMSDNAASSSA